MGETAEDIARDVAAIGRIDAVPALLKLVCETTGMGLSAVTRVSDESSVVCGVEDRIGFGLSVGGRLDPHMTRCKSCISVPIVMRDGSCFGHLCAIDPEPMKAADPRFMSLFTLFAELIASQIGHQREHQRQMDLARSAFLDERAAGELREQFVAVLGHDLSGPLTAITVGTELLLRHSGDEAKVLGIAHRIAGSAKRMGALLDDVLDFARGRLGGGFEVRLSEIADFEDAMRDVAAEVQLAWPGRSIATDILVEGIVLCDRDRIQQLVSNLLNNAMQYGAKGTPIHFSALADGQSIVLTVSNEGEPIPAESLPKVFGPFWRRTGSGKRQSLGLGLFICAEIVKAHGGTIEVMSSAQDGTTFAARLPYPPAA